MKKEEEDSTPVLVAKSASYHSSDSRCAWRICDNNAMMKRVVFSVIFLIILIHIIRCSEKKQTS